jgi:hypothetical protein
VELLYVGKFNIVRVGVLTGLKSVTSYTVEELIVTKSQVSKLYSYVKGIISIVSALK